MNETGGLDRNEIGLKLSDFTNQYSFGGMTPRSLGCPRSSRLSEIVGSSYGVHFKYQPALDDQLDHQNIRLRPLSLLDSGLYRFNLEISGLSPTHFVSNIRHQNRCYLIMPVFKLGKEVVYVFKFSILRRIRLLDVSGLIQMSIK